MTHEETWMGVSEQAFVSLQKLQVGEENILLSPFPFPLALNVWSCGSHTATMRNETWPSG
jgi:hypothetical protein